MNSTKISQKLKIFWFGKLAKLKFTDTDYIKSYAEACSEPFQTSKVKRFLLAVKYF